MTATETSHRLSLDGTAALLAQLTGVNGADARKLLIASARWPKDSVPDDGPDLGPAGRRLTTPDEIDIDPASLAAALATSFGCPVADAEQLVATMVDGAAAPSDKSLAGAATWRQTVFHDEPHQPQRKKTIT